MSDEANLYSGLAAAYVRGMLPDLGASSNAEAIAIGRSRGLKLYPFKRSAELPRVRAVLGVLRNLAPTNLLDIGSGRGVFLWPLLDAFAGLAVTAIDIADHRVDMLAAVRRGGIERLSVERMDVTALACADRTFDVVTVLEVLEHLERPEAAAREVLRVGRRAVIASVPSREDNNPQHIRLFDRASLTELFAGAGARRIKIDYVLNHMICVVTP
jgi:cyclopropane fatty-acyl-phospholipid synthase-like methyltransferase